MPADDGDGGIAAAKAQHNVEGKRRDLLSLTLFLRQHYPTVRSWEQVQRYPHLERWLNHLHDSPLKPNTRMTHPPADFSRA